jgi:acetyl-CoA synthetase
MSKEIENYWATQAEKISWFKPWSKVKETSFNRPVSIKWFIDGKLNVSYNCIDRHLAKRADQVAIIWESDEPNEPSQKITYKELHKEVCKLANAYKKLGIKKGDRVTIYLPMIPEAAYALLACARIGAIHSVVFGGFAPESIADRMTDGDSKFIVTTVSGRRGGKKILLLDNVRKAIAITNAQIKTLVVGNVGDTKLSENEVDYLKLKNTLSDQCEPEIMDAEDPLFLLYTSGSTNKPKGVLHTTGGYLVYAAHTFKTVFDYRDKEIYFCSADVGWVTGHSYLLYGPLANGATTVMFEGVPNYPDASRFWQIIDKHKVNIFYTAPTAIRALIVQGDEYVKKTSRKSLRILGSVGEPINPAAWNWYHDVVGEGRCPIVDTWWQTETGGILISPLPNVTKLKPGSATLPLFGIEPVLLTPDGKVIEGPGEGVLAIKDSWPGQMRTVYGDHKRFEETYFSTYPGYYFTGDGCRRDEDGYYWITGRVDDVLNVSGHRIGTAEVESAIVAHPSVGEAAVVGYPHDIKGQGIYAFVTLKSGVTGDDALKKEIIAKVREIIGPIALPDKIQWARGLPKTRSGKIMRRIIRKIAENQLENLGDTSTLADPSVVEDLVRSRVDA